MNSLPIYAHETLYLHGTLANVFGHRSGYLRIEWHTVPMVSAEVRQLFDEILHVLCQQQLHRLFTERTVAPPLHAVDCQWVTQQWLPQARREAGLSHFAVVESNIQVAARALHPIGESGAAGPVQFRFFDSFAQAQVWIREAA